MRSCVDSLLLNQDHKCIILVAYSENEHLHFLGETALCYIVQLFQPRYGGCILRIAFCSKYIFQGKV